MFNFLKGVVGGSGGGQKDLPYNIGDPYPSAWSSWSHFRGTSKDDGSPVSIFSLSGSNPQDGRLAAGRNGVKRLRTVRHPNILSFLYSTEVETVDGSGTKVTIYIVTEPAMPLSEKIKELSLEGTQRDEYYAWGLHQIAKAVSFLNNDCKLVKEDTSWHGYLLTFVRVDTGYYSCLLDACVDRECLALRCLIYEIFSGMKLGKTEELRNTASIPKSLLPDYQRLLSSTPSRRLNASKLIENSEYFQNKLVETIHFMEILSLKDSVEKDTFFRKLPNLTEQLPRQIVLKKLFPLLTSALEYGSAAAPALTALLKIGSWLSAEEYTLKVLPTIIKLFASNDRAIRVSLLQHIDQYGESLSARVVDEQVYPHVATGFVDTSSILRELTLKSMLIMAPKEWANIGWHKSFLAMKKIVIVLMEGAIGAILLVDFLDVDIFKLLFCSLQARNAIHLGYAWFNGKVEGWKEKSENGKKMTFLMLFLISTFSKGCFFFSLQLSQRNLSGSLLKYLSKLQVDEEPAIRTNTTILLGNIASFLNDGTRKRVLINAFTVRALRDTFSPARGAGVMALCATSSYYDTTEIATRILPNIVVLTIDPDSDVRSKVFQAVDQFMQILKQSNEKSNAGDTSHAGSLGLSSMPGNAGLLEWAMSSLTLKGKPSDQAPIAASNSVRPVTTTTAASSGLIETPSMAPVRVSSSSDFADAPAPPSPTSTDGWGEIENGIHGEQYSDKDGWDDIEPLEEPKPSSVLANIQAAQKRPVSQPKPQATSLRSKSTVKAVATKDEDDDLWGSIAVPTPKIASKSLKVKTSGAVEDDDPWAAIAAPPPTTKAKPLSAGRGRGTKAAAPKLGAQRINRTSSSGMQ
ncbi:hypothetical protein Goari_005203 [Gossypium aridum]|uniref:Protein kinase domain-containing protein n=1 Tax=Gossypium aridum TaxID=34290 RepID=A0A7J8Y5T3_GOSAI|nr:hypothetical protein [Gossypium aridum]